jgi:transposase InsO family protein
MKRISPRSESDQAGISPTELVHLRQGTPNGVAERFNRTLKEQAIHGRIFRNLNRHWRLEKLGFMSPLEARQAHALKRAA